MKQAWTIYVVFLFSFYLLWKILGKNNITKVFSCFVSFQSNAGHSIIIVILLLLHVYQAAWSFIYENLENFNSIILSMHKIRVCIENISRTEVFDVITKTRTVLQIIIFWVCLVLKYTDNEQEFKKTLLFSILKGVLITGYLRTKRVIEWHMCSHVS